MKFAVFGVLTVISYPMSDLIYLSRELTRPSDRSIHLRMRTAVLTRVTETYADYFRACEQPIYYEL